MAFARALRCADPDAAAKSGLINAHRFDMPIARAPLGLATLFDRKST
jgi:hypothetical protein